MTAPKDCSHFVPLHTAELVEVLSSDSEFTEIQREQFCELAGLIGLTHHLRYYRRQVDLKSEYAPFDPDSDVTNLIRLSAAEKQRRSNKLFSDFAWLLDRAHFRHLGREEIEPMLASASEWGINMQVDFSAFEHVALFIRGEAHQERVLNNWRTWYQDQTFDVPIFRRLVLILKFRPHPRLGRDVNADHVYLKLFKDIPRADVDMLLPAANVKLRLLDRGKIGVGLLSGLATMVWRMFAELTHFVQTMFLSNSAFWGLTAGCLGYGYKSYYDYQQTRQSYHLNLAQSLYFQNLDCNAGVLTRLFDEAEEQETRTALLAYYVLLRHAGPEGFNTEQMEMAMELFLDRYAEIPLLTEPGEPFAKLQRLGLVRTEGDRHRPVPLPEALVLLRDMTQPSDGAQRRGQV